jgi:uncharacterized SAM-binding protein YcdF (DUF218 family)
MGPLTIFLWHRRNKVANEKSWGRRIFFALNLILWLAFFTVLAIVCTPLTDYMIKSLAVKEDIRKADVIVVLAGGIDKGRYLSLVSSHRLLRGGQFYFEGRAKKILFSGGAPKKMGVAEATVMAQEARRFNIPAADIIVEKRSHHTHEQAAEIKKIGESQRWKSILLVTSYSHMKRSLMTFERAGFKVYPAPADPYEKYITDPLGRLRLFKILLHEYGGIIYYKIKGWI